MSIHFDPKSSQTHSEILTTPHQPTPSLWMRYMQVCVEGYEMETTPSKTYCERKWQLQGKDSSKTPDKFMTECIKDCEFVKQFSDWHHKN